MRPELLALLAAHDHPKECESPPGFDYKRSLARVKALVPALQRIAGVELELDDTVQDASFFCDVGSYREVSPRTFFPIIVVRFSAFGDLVTMTRADDFDPAAFTNMITALGEAGFVYVPADELEERYTGRNPHIGDQSWWIRFFDYL